MRKVKIGVIGRGCRGSGLMDTMRLTDMYEFVIICDKYQDRVEAGQAWVQEKMGYTPLGTTDYHEVLANKDVEAVLVSCDWEMHLPIAIDAIKANKAIALEVGGAYTLQECFDVVEAWEANPVPFMFLENCCYNKDELLALAMARNGEFGRIVYCSGSYAHDLRGEVTCGKENRHYRLRNYLNRNCENYPTHELGPIAKILDINRGNRMVSLVSMASGSFGMEAYVEKKQAEGKYVNDDLIGTDFAQGDIVNTIISCENGEQILLRLDTSLPRSYSREFTVRGTKGLYEQAYNATYFDGEREYWEPSDYAKNNINNAERHKDFLPSFWRDITKEQMDAGHGGMDFFELVDFATRLVEGRPMPIDVYDCAAWMAITPLTEASIKAGGAPQQIPDFTKGAYKTRPRFDVTD
jgi:hypothetical protein